MNVASADHDARTGVRVAVTGVRGATADALLARLAADPDLGRVVVVDRERPARLPAGVQFVRADLRDALLSRLFADVDVVVNAVLADDVTRFRRDLLATSVQSTRRVLDAADAAGVGALVHVSSAMVYGAAERNRVPLTEQEPLRAAARFAAVQEALHAEEAVRAYAGEHPHRRVVVLRPVPAIVPDVDSAVTRHLESPFLPMVRGFDPPVQFIAVDDLATAVHLVVRDERARGIYNVAADGWLTSSDVRRIVARPVLRLPRETAVAVATALHRAGLLAVPPSALDYLMHPWVVDTSRLHALGWTPTVSQRAMLHQFVTEHRRWLSVGRLRVRTNRLIAGIAIGWSVVVSGASWLVWRRWSAGRRDA
ncbi:MAG TPA: NAD-dependent epimerase/dehydratase family protein [Euzebyales bacterium]